MEITKYCVTSNASKCDHHINFVFHCTMHYIKVSLDSLFRSTVYLASISCH